MNSDQAAQLLNALDAITKSLDSIAISLDEISVALGPLDGPSTSSIIDQLHILNQKS